ncbi:MAG: hypothetical protein Kow0029_05430 [Candidatus Rifleibacteriota bacterium]
MQANGIKTSFIQKLAIPILLIMLVMPFLFFYKVISDLIVIEERQLEAIAREKLLLESQSFQNDLDCQKFVETALRKMNRDFGFVAPNSRYGTVFPDQHDPKLIDKNFISSAIRYLKKKYGLKPLLIIAADTDLQHSYSWFSPGLIPNKRDRKEFVENAVVSTAVNETLIRNILNNSTSIQERIQRILEKSKYTNVHHNFSELFRKHISYFSQPPLYPDKCEKFFSNIGKNQRFYHYTYTIPRPFPNGYEGTYGVYYMVFRGEDIKPDNIVKNALSFSSHGAKRYLIKKSIDKPFFTENKKGLFYISNMPSSFYQALVDRSLKQFVSKKKLKDFFRTHAICTFLDSRFLKSENRQLLKLLSLSGKVIVLILYPIIIISLIRLDRVRLKLNHKLKIAVALVIFVPVAAIFITGKLINSAIQKHRIISIQTRMKRHLRLFEQYWHETQTIILTRLLQRKKTDSIVFMEKDFSLQKLMELYKKQMNVGIDHLSLFLDINGRNLFFDESLKIVRKLNRFERVGLFKVLNELGQVNINSPAIKKITKEQYLLGTYGDSFWQVYATSDNLARENEYIHDFFTIEPLKKVILQFIATSLKPFKPFVIHCYEVGGANYGKHYLEKLAMNGNLKTSEHVENCTIDYGIFLRTSNSLRKFSYPHNSAVIRHLKAVAEKAIKMRSSGSSTSRETSETVLSSWIFQDDSPIVFVGQARFLNEGGTSFMIELLPWLLITYGLIATILISNGLSNFFLKPVELLLKGISLVNSSFYNFKLQPGSYDEFANLSDSFNKMNEGLVEREKMKRFVSDKLFESIQNEKEISTKETGSVELVVLSSDIRNFTTISEQNDPELVVSLLNDYLTAMEIAIKKFDGSIEKIIGDAIIATFYGDNLKESLIRACKASMAMKQSLKVFNDQRKLQHLFTIENGVGIASGIAVSGFAGGRARRKEFVLIGEVFRESEKLEAKSKYGRHSKIILNDDAKNKLDDSFEFTLLQSENIDQSAWELVINND